MSEKKEKYFAKVASESAITCTWYRLLDTESLFAKYVWMQLPLFDLYQLGIGLEFSMLPYEFQPFAVDFNYYPPNMDELMQGIWANFDQVVYEIEFPWSFDWDKLNEFLFNVELFKIPRRKAKYGEAKFFGYIYDPALSREYIAEAFARLRLIRKPDLSWKTALETVSEVLNISPIAIYEIVSRFFLLSSAQDNSFCLGLSPLGTGKLNGTPDGGAVIPYVTPEGELIEVKYWTLENLMFGFILGVTPLGYGVLTPKTPMFKMEDPKKNPEIIDFIMNKARKAIHGVTLTTWAYSNYNKPEEMLDYHKSEKVAMHDLIQTQRRMVENLVYEAIANTVANPVLIRQYQNAVLQAIAWKSKRHCYDEKTEILTENGWKKYHELKVGEKVATLNKNGIIEYQPIKNIYLYPYKGKMYSLRNNVIDLMVTPEHKLYISTDYKSKNPKFELIKAKDVFGKRKRFKKDGIWIAEDNQQYFILPEVDNPTHKSPAKKIPMEEWLKFFGFWLAEGSTTLNGRGKHEFIVSISNSNTELLDEIANLCHRWGFNPIKSRSHNLQIYSKQLYSYLKQFGKAKDKYIPKEIKNLPSKYLKILFEYMMKGDGHIGSGGDSYSTTSKKLADDIQEIALKIGRVAHIRFDKFTRAGKPLYKVTILKPIHNMPIVFHKNYLERHEKWVDYNGIVWCVETDNGIVYVRRSGKPVWSGNSWGYRPFRNTPEEQFKEWWVLHWKEMGLDETILRRLYDYITPWLDRIREVKQRIGASVRLRRRMLASSPHL